ncbi:hypothetical protein ACRAKI_09875 [Saccharothrix isguenensis]
MADDDGARTEHVRMPMPPGGDAGRHPGRPRLADPDAERSEDDAVEAAESGGHPHSGRPHRVTGDEELPGEWERDKPVSPPEDR